jgi:hypothetical protein
MVCLNSKLPRKGIGKDGHIVGHLIRLTFLSLKFSFCGVQQDILCVPPLGTIFTRLSGWMRSSLAVDAFDFHNNM